MPIEIKDKSTGIISSATPDEINQIVGYSNLAGSSVHGLPVVISSAGEFERVGSGTISLFEDADTTSITVGSITIPVIIYSDDLTMGTSGGTVEIDGSTVTIADSGASTTVNGDTVVIGDSSSVTSSTTVNGKTINIGESGSTINMMGDVNNQLVTNLNVTDKLITLNDGGAVGSGNSVGIEVEENALATGYVKTKSDRNGWNLKAPNQTGIATVEIDSDDFTVDKTIVKGPTSGTDNKLLKSDGTNGRLIQESGITIDDTDNMSGVGTISSGTITSSGDVDAVNVSVTGKLETAETASRALTTDVNGDVTASAVTSTELEYLSGTTSNVQTQIDANETAINDHLADTTDAHDASAISNVASGNLASTNVQDSLEELQADVDTRALDSDLDAHTADTSAHGVTGDVVGTTDTQTVTNKTIVAADNTITTAASGNLTSTELNAALSELQTDIDTRALDSDLDAHVAATSAHGTTGDVVGTSDTQVITNKDIDGGTASNTSRLTVPKNTKANLDALTRKEATLVFATDQKTAYIDDGTNLSELGSGGQGGINYVDNYNLKLNDDGYSTYADAAGVNAVDGTGGTANITFARNTSTPLRGDADGLLTKDAADRQGEGVSYDFTIDDADKAKKLTISFDYLVSTDYADDDIRVAVYDVTNAQLIRVNGEDLKAKSLPGKHYAQFQTASNSTSYRLILHISSTNASAYTVNVDNVTVGPREVAYGSYFGDKYSANKLSVNVDNNGTTASAKTGEYSPEIWWDSITRDSTGIVSVDYTSLGLTSIPGFSAIPMPEGEGTNRVVNYYDATATSVKIRTQYWGSTTGPFLNDFDFSLEISKHGDDFNKGGQAMSEDLGGREVVVQGASNGGESITGSTDITFTEVEDSTASWTGTQFTTPEKGKYLVEGNIFISSSTTSDIYAFVDGTNHKTIGYGATRRHPFSAVVDLEKGEVLSIRMSSSATLSSSSTEHWIHIQKLASPQTMFETATVAARYTSDSGQTVASGGTIVYEDLDHDTHNAYDSSTGEYTVPVSGKYHVVANARTGSAVNLSLVIEVDGTMKAGSFNAGGDSSTPLVSTTLDLAKNQVVKIINNAGGSVTLVTAEYYNYFSIARIK